MFLVLAAVGVIDAFWMPMWPDTVYRFFTRIFHLDGWPEIVLINNFTGIIFCVYWFGVFDLLAVYVQPREEGYVDLLLSKPVRRTDFMFAKLAPSFIVLMVMAAAAAAVHAAAMVACNLVLEPQAYTGTVAIILAFTILLLAISNLLMLPSATASRHWSWHLSRSWPRCCPASSTCIGRTFIRSGCPTTWRFRPICSGIPT